MKIHASWRGRACAALLALSAASCDFVSPTERDPNAIPTTTVDQLFTGIQVNTFFLNESQMNRLAAIWLQQMAGTDRQFQGYDLYIFVDGDEVLDGEFSSIYTGGGLIDLRRAIQLAEEAGWSAYAGILKIHEAWMFGTAASIWGDIPYSEAGNPEIPQPALDEQTQVYASVLSLLDEAIADLAAGGIGPATFDLNFGGDVTAWTKVAHSLKARFNLHLAELEGSSRYQAALAEAQLGIDAPSGNWRSIHSTAATENNLWYQFLRDRSGYIAAGAFGVDLLKTSGDPRLALYYTTATGAFEGQYAGSPPGSPAGDPGVDASLLNVPGQLDYDQPILTCAETQFIAAEAAYQLGDVGGAQSHLAAGIACQEANWGVSIDYVNPSSLSGAALLETIIEQKYIANFLNMEIWNDYKRTCLPAITPAEGGIVPARIFYGQTERQTNTNIPSPDAQPARNDNDPNAC